MIRATFQQLRLFKAVAHNRSFTRAAREVHLSQPAVSIQIKRLEEVVGQPLFEQLGKQIYLTAAGKGLYAASDDIFTRLEQLEAHLDELRGQVAGVLKIAVVTTAKYFLPHYLGAFVRQYGQVRPRLKVTNRANVLARMDENSDDLYILSHLPEVRELVKTHFLDDELVFFVSPEHHLAQKKQIPLKLIAKERMLFREEGSGTRMAFDKMLAKKEIPVEPHLELGSGEAIKQAAIAGLGIGMLSTYSLRLELETGCLVILDVEDMPIPRKWHVVYPKGKRLSLPAQKFVQFLTEQRAVPR